MRKLIFLMALFVGAHAAEAQEVSIHSDTLRQTDTILIIRTVCAPVCSSIVFLYDTAMKQIGRAQPPIVCVFPEAYIEDQQLKWRDNTPLIFDEEEKRWIEQQQKH